MTVLGSVPTGLRSQLFGGRVPACRRRVARSAPGVAPRAGRRAPASRIEWFPHCRPLGRVRLEARERAPRRYPPDGRDRKSTRLNSSHVAISYAVFCLIKKTIKLENNTTYTY